MSAEPPDETDAPPAFPPLVAGEGAEGPAGTGTASWPAQALWVLGRSLAAACGLAALLALTFLALGIAPANGLSALWVGAFGDAQSGHLYPLSETLVKTSPLLLTGLSVVVAWRAGLFS